MSPPYPAHLRPRRALFEAITMAAILPALACAAPAFRGSLWLGVALLPAVMMMGVSLLSRRDPAWRASLGLGSAALRRTIARAAAGFAFAYAASITATVIFSVIEHGRLASVLRERASWMRVFAALPLGAALVVALLAGIWEEIFFRGFLLGRLRVALRGAVTARDADALALAMTSVVFGAGHGYQGSLGFVQTAAIGAVMGALTLYSESLWPAIVAHAAIDTVGMIAIRALELPALERISQM